MHASPRKNPASSHQRPWPVSRTRPSAHTVPTQPNSSGASGVGETPKISYSSVRFSASSAQKASRASRNCSSTSRASSRFQPSDHSTAASLTPNTDLPTRCVVSQIE